MNTKTPVSTLLNALVASDPENAAANFLAILRHSTNFDLAAEDGYALIWAIEQGHQELVDKLLNDDRINVNAGNGRAFAMAMQQPDSAICKLVYMFARLNFKMIEFEDIKGVLQCAVAFGTLDNLRHFLEWYYWYDEKLDDLLTFAYAQKHQPEIITLLLDTMGPDLLCAYDFFRRLCEEDNLAYVQAVLPFVEYRLSTDADFVNECWYVGGEVAELIRKYYNPAPSVVVDNETVVESDKNVVTLSDVPATDSAGEQTVPTIATVTLPDGTTLQLHIHITISQQQQEQPSQKINITK